MLSRGLCIWSFVVLGLVGCASSPGPPQAPWSFEAWKRVSEHPEQRRGVVQFFVTADTQYKDDLGTRDIVNTLVVREMNRLISGTRISGVTWPDGGSLYGIRGVVIAGDLTHTSKGNPCTDDGVCDNTALGRFDYYWSGGVEGRSLLNVPVYEGLGNHDMRHNVATLVRARNRVGRPVIEYDDATGWVLKKTTRTHPLGHYAWDWDGVHMVQLNDHAGYRESEAVVSPRRVASLDSMEFLKKDLSENVKDQSPVILSQHMGFDGFSAQTRGVVRGCDALFDQSWEWDGESKTFRNESYTPERCLGVLEKRGTTRVAAVPCGSKRAWRWEIHEASGHVMLSHPTRDLCVSADGYAVGDEVTVEPCDSGDMLQAWERVENTLRLTRNVCLSMKDRWWSEVERQEMYRVADPYNVVALFSGHAHSYQPDMPVWSGIANKNAGAAFWGQFLAVRLDANQGTLKIARRCLLGGRQRDPSAPVWVWSSVRDRGCSAACDPDQPGDCFFEVRWDVPGGEVAQNPK